jgi:Zn-dependent peptidase ImmA (M78 family)
MTKAESEQNPFWNGYCVWSEEHKSAGISISKKAEHIQHTIIHELLHIRLDGHAPMLEAQSVSTEVTVNAMASMLLVLEGTHV